jgi:hypothetical protein
MYRGRGKQSCVFGLIAFLKVLKTATFVGASADELKRIDPQVLVESA